MFRFLSKENTAPFMLVSVVYALILASPFIYFTILKSKPHNSNSVVWDENLVLKNKDSLKNDTLKATDSISYFKGGNSVPLNKFDRVDETLPSNDESPGEESVYVTTNNSSNWKMDADSRGFIMLTKIAIFSIILAFGALGAAISLITRTRNNEKIFSKITAYEILSIQTIGGIFAVILGFAFMGNMISGTLFPNPIVFTRVIYVPPAFGKLIVWSFIAGFSERFVPDLLSGFIKKGMKEEPKIVEEKKN